MGSHLADEQIRSACECLLAQQRKVGVRDVMRLLKSRHGASGRTGRVAAILRRFQEQQVTVPNPPAAEDSAEILDLRRSLREAEARADRAEELERHHQDFWANRYAERVAELERKYAALGSRGSVVSAEQYLRIYQRAAELARRLSKYEEVEVAEGLGEARDGPSR